MQYNIQWLQGISTDKHQLDLFAHFLPIIVILGGFAFLVFRARTTHFECPACGYSFKMSGIAYAVTPHMFGRNYVTCPNCGYRGMMPSINDEE